LFCYPYRTEEQGQGKSYRLRYSSPAPFVILQSKIYSRIESGGAMWMNLAESIIEDYPIGTIVLWKHARLEARSSCKTTVPLFKSLRNAIADR
jgi:hypothetical protein